MWTDEQFINYLKNSYTFNGITNGITQSEAERILDDSTITSQYYIEFGCTKMVFIPIEKSDYVYKCNFFGGFDDECYNSDESEADYIAYYAENECDEHNYCDEELYFCNEFVEHGFGDYIAKVEPFETVGKITFFKQERAIMEEAVGDSYIYSSKDSKEKAKLFYTDYCGEIGVDWLANFIEQYGEETLEEFLDYVINWLGINDLHNGNIGYIDGHCVLVDYSGYYGLNLM
jgi:hypothetical protein